MGLIVARLARRRWGVEEAHRRGGSARSHPTSRDETASNGSCGSVVPVYMADFAQGGAQWFVDLGMADPTNALPIIVTASFIAVAEVSQSARP